jgi:hypothetical protein
MFEFTQRMELALRDSSDEVTSRGALTFGAAAGT